MIITNKTTYTVEEIREKAFTEGVLILVDKPVGWSSFDAVAKVRGATQIKKVGHGGTLDPLATGLLVIALGKATKQLESYSASDKTYRATLKLGNTTKTFDMESDEENLTDISHLTNEVIESAIASFEGVQMQMPPIYSAKKVNGVRSYELARRNEEVVLKAREINITNIKVNVIDLPYVVFDVTCSKGTYIRSLCNDIGERLGVGGYMSNLIRTRVMDFDLEDAISGKVFHQMKKDNEHLKLKRI